MAHSQSNLLNAQEHFDLYGIPLLNDIERTEHFTLSQTEIKVMRTFRSVTNAVYFVISLSFYKLKGTLIDFAYQDVSKERQHVMQRYFPGKISPRTLPKNADTIAQIRKKVLAICRVARPCCQDPAL